MKTVRQLCFAFAGGFVVLMMQPAAVLGQHGGHDIPKAADSQPAPAQKRTGDLYPLETCPVTGAQLGSMGAPYVYLHEGREVRFCCKGCDKKFQASPETYLKKIDGEIAKRQKAVYPVDYCLTMPDEKIESDESKNFYWVRNNRLFVFCCKGCEKKVAADPDKYTQLLNEAVVAAQKKKYSAEVCVVSGEKLGSMGEGIDYVFDGRLVRLCCQSCVRKFEADPHQYMKNLKGNAGREPSGKPDTAQAR